MSNEESRYYLVNIETKERIPIRIDDYTNTHVLLDLISSMINSGKNFFFKTVLDITGDEFITEFMFTTPNTATRINAKAIVSANSEFLVEIFEGVTTSADGTPVEAFNNDRDSEIVPELVLHAAPTVTDDGEKIWSAKVGDGKSAGVNSPLGYIIKAKTNSKYLFRITKKTSGTHFLDVDFFWFEHAGD